MLGQTLLLDLTAEVLATSEKMSRVAMRFSRILRWHWL